MARYYSDQFTPDGVGQTSVPNVRVKVDESIDGGLVRYKRAQCHVAGLDVSGPNFQDFRFMTVKSSDRLLELRVTSNPAQWDSSNNMKFGIFQKEPAHEGVAIDDDLLNDGTLLEIAVTAEFDDVLIDGNAGFSVLSIGKQLWELVNEATPGTYAADPIEQWDLGGTLLAVGANLGGLLMVELVYVA